VTAKKILVLVHSTLVGWWVHAFVYSLVTTGGINWIALLFCLNSLYFCWDAAKKHMNILAAKEKIEQENKIKQCVEVFK
jgi:hypothetical protein